MSFLNKLFNKKSSEEEEAKEQPVNLSLDDSFVHHFIKKGGKFIYCTTIAEVEQSLDKILKENSWKYLVCLEKEIAKLLKKSFVKHITEYTIHHPYFTTCEHLIADNGHILFSSNQIGSEKLSNMSKNFIVFAKTSQLVKDTGQGLTGIKANSKNNIPTNISAIKNYQENQDFNDFLSYGNTNTKNLYLLLLEDF